MVCADACAGHRQKVILPAKYGFYIFNTQDVVGGAEKLFVPRESTGSCLREGTSLLEIPSEERLVFKRLLGEKFCALCELVDVTALGAKEDHIEAAKLMGNPHGMSGILLRRAGRVPCRVGNDKINSGV